MDASLGAVCRKFSARLETEAEELSYRLETEAMELSYRQLKFFLLLSKNDGKVFFS